MREQMPTNPTNAQRAEIGGMHHVHPDGALMPYVPVWKRLPEAIKHLTAGGRPKDQAQTELCQAIGDWSVKIRGKLKKHTTRHLSASGTVLQGTDFHIPAEIKWHMWTGKVLPAETMDGPTREFSAIGILGFGVDPRFRTADVTNVLCSTGKPGELSTCLEETAARTQSGRRSKARSRPLALVQDRPPGRETRCGWAGAPSRAETTEI